MFDVVSYILGLVKGENDGKGTVVVEPGDEYTFTDPNGDGNIVVTKEEG